jgi:serine/threonine-protein kinase
MDTTPAPVGAGTAGHGRGGAGTVSRDPLLGQLLDGRYRVEARVARGGMACVYTATDLRLDRVVAVKVMHAALADDEEFVRRFIQEAKAVARISHPNVVSVFDQGEDGDAVFLVMEYVDGHTLRNLLRERGRLSPAEAMAVIQPVLAALAAAHDAGLVHRDVKPENVLLADNGRVKVVDFGLARAVAASTMSHASVVVGTVAYLAPEQVEHSIADARADLFAAGVMLYEMLAGTLPFRGDAPLAVALKRLRDDVPLPSALAPEVPPEVDCLVAHATARSPGDRPADAGELLVEAAQVRDRLGPHAAIPRPDTPSGEGSRAAALPAEAANFPADPSPAPRRRRTRWRRRWPYLLALAVILAALAGITGWWYAAGRWVRVPNLSGLSRTAAQQQLRGLDLAVAVRGRHSDTVAKGHVVGQRPGAGADLRHGRSVTAFVSTGPRMVTVPDVRGQPAAVARASLRKSALHVADVKKSYDDKVKRQRVIRTRPVAGHSLRHDSPVVVYLSKGAKPVAVPSAVGKSVREARSLLSTAGFKPKVAAAVYSNLYLVGAVVEQSPADTKAQPGATVTITPSKGPRLFAVPDVRGHSAKAAVRELKQEGFPATVIDFFGAGTVARERPSAGTSVRKGTTIRLLD